MSMYIVVVSWLIFAMFAVFCYKCGYIDGRERLALELKARLIEKWGVDFAEGKTEIIENGRRI